MAMNDERAVDDPVLQTARERYTYGRNAWRDIRDEGKTDVRMLAGDQWEPADVAARKDAGRPAVVFDELNQYVNQSVNDLRQNKRGIKVTAVGNGANDKTAEYRQGRIRQIEYRSNATSAYLVMAENVYQRGYGFLKILPRYKDSLDQDGRPSFSQELFIEEIPNPDTVTMDPDVLKQTGKGMNWAFHEERLTVTEFKRKFKNAEIHDFDGELAKRYPDWIGADHVTVAEYWAREVERRKAVALQTPDGRVLTMWADELDTDERKAIKSLENFRERWYDDISVVRRVTNGLEILEEETYENKILKRKARSIPIVSCFGKVLYVEGGSGTERRLLSLVRLARNPQKLYNYYRTTEMELVGMTPKFPYFAVDGQLSPAMEEKLAESLHVPVALIKYKAQVEGVPPGQILPPPSRNPYEPPIQPLEIGAESARRGIMSAIGNFPLPTQALRQNEKSGIALGKIESASQKGSFHFTDHIDEAIVRTGEILDELLPIFEDTADTVTVRGNDESVSQVRINDPQNPQAIDTSVGDHDLTLSIGPSFDSQREAADAFADQLAQNPQIFSMIADLVVKLKNLGPIGDEIASRLVPPQFRNLKQLDPQTMAMQLQQAQQMVQQLQQALGQTTLDLRTEAAKQKATIEKAKIDADKDIKLRAMQDAALIEVAKINALAKGVVAAVDANAGAIALDQEHVHDNFQAEADRAHDVTMQAMQPPPGQPAQPTGAPPS